jgi:hypothetical protein
MEVGPDHPISASVTDAVLGADEDEEVIVSRTCWACGWGEDRSVVIEAINTTQGDEATIERARLLDEITDELDAIDTVATLEDALAEIRRQRRLEPSSTDTDEDARE